MKKLIMIGLMVAGAYFAYQHYGLSSFSGSATDVDSGSQEVVMYVTKRCGWCTRASRFFQEHNIDVFEYDIGESYEYKQKFDQLGGRGTPLIYIGGQRIDGFNEKAIKVALKNVDLM